MTEQKKQSNPKPFIPLIIFLSLIVVATVVITHMRLFSKQTAATDFSGNPIRIVLSPYSRRNSPSIPAPPAAEIIDGMPNAEQALLLANRDIEAGKLARAEDRLRTAIVFHPANENLYSLLGNTLYIQGKYKEAEGVFRRQAHLNPQDNRAYNNLGAALAKQKRYKEAITTIRQVLKCEPDSVTAFLNLAGMHSMAGEKETAIEYFRKAYEILGERIIPLAHDRNFNNIRQEPEFVEIIKAASARSASGESRK